MQKMLLYTLALILLTFSVSFAVDKKSDKKKERAKVDTLIKMPDNQSQSATGSQPKDYNNFIDKNNNGVDDRAENQKRVSVKKTDTSQTKTKGTDTQSTEKK